MSISMFILTMFSIFWGFLTSDLLVGWGTFFWNDSIFPLPSNFFFIDAEFLSPLIKNLPLIFSMLGLFVGFFLISFYNYISQQNFYLFNYLFLIWNTMSSFFYHAGYFNLIYNNMFLFIFEFSYITTNKYIDKGLLEFFGPFGFYKIFRIFSTSVQKFSPTIMFFVVGWMFFFIIFFIFFMFLCSDFLIFFMLNPGLLYMIVSLNVMTWIYKNEI